MCDIEYEGLDYRLRTNTGGKSIKIGCIEWRMIG